MNNQKQLGQNRPSTADTPETIYTVPAGTQATNMLMYVCNQSGSASTYSVYQDDTGSGSGTTTVLHFDVSIAANETVLLQIPPMSTENGIITVAAGDNNALTFTLGGMEVTDPAHKILGQAFLADTTATTIYTVPANTTTIGLILSIVNQDSSAATYRVYQDDDGDALGSSNHVAWEIAISANSRQQLSLLPMNNSGGVVGVRASSGNIMCFTLAGTEL